MSERIIGSADSDCPPDAPRVPDARGVRSSIRANLADHYVGQRIRERRNMLGMSQQQLASLIGVTCQQAHKYERGVNRIAAGRLFEVARALGVPVAWFFDGFEDARRQPGEGPAPDIALGLPAEIAAVPADCH